MPAIIWGLLVGLIIAMLSITRRGEIISTSLDLMQYPPFDKIASQVIAGIIVGSLLNFFIWTLIATFIIWALRKVFQQSSEFLILVYSVVVIALLILGMTYFGAIQGLSENVVQAVEMSTPTRDYVLITPISKPEVTVYFPPPMPGANDISGSDTLYSKMTAENYGKFFGVEIVEAYHSYTDMNLVSYNEFCDFYEKEMIAKGFSLDKKGGNYLIFYNKSLDKHIGIIYDEVVKSYKFAQW